MNNLHIPFLVSILFLSLSVCASAAQPDPQNAIAALNYAITSIDRVEKNPTRKVVEEEYDTLYDNFNYANIPFTPEMRSLINSMMLEYTATKLDEKDREMLRRNYETQVNRAFLEVKPLSHIQTEAAVQGAKSVAASIDSQGSLLGNLFRGTLAAAGAAGDYVVALQANERIRQQAKGQEQQFMQDRVAGEWQLDKEFIHRLNRLKTELINANWAILTENNLSDDNRFTQSNLKEYQTFLSAKDSQAAIRIGKSIERLFSNYAPFWFHLGAAYMESGDLKAARKCFEKFEDVNRPIWRVDKYAAANARYKIFTLDSTEKEEAKRLLSIIERNTTSDDWNTILFAALQNYQLGDKNKAVQLIYHNIDLDYNKPLNEEILRQVKDDNIDLNAVQGVAIKEFREPSELENLARSGNAEAQFRLGEINFRNYKRNEVKEWLQKAAEQGHLLADARLYFIQNCSNKEDNSGKKYIHLDKLLSRDDQDAQIILGDYYQNGCGVLKDMAKAANYFLPQAEAGDAYSAASLGAIASSQQDYSKMFKWYQKAADLGDSSSPRQLGHAFRTGTGVDKDIAMAIKSYKIGADKGDRVSQFWLGFIYETENELKNLEEAFKWYEKSALKDFPPAQFVVGDMLSKGTGTTKNIDKALEYLNKSAAQDYSPALNKLAGMYQTGDGLKKDYSKAFSYYQKGADQGDAFSQLALGTMYFKGEGVASNPEEAKKWWTLSANQGNDIAKENLKFIDNPYASSSTPTTDASKDWFAATQAFAHGDKNTARILWRKACTGGSKSACMDLRKHFGE